MVCTQLFDEQDDAYKAELLPNVSPDETLRVSIEAGTTFGWDRYTMTNGLRIGIDRFGASAPAGDLFEKFGFTADAIWDSANAGKLPTHVYKRGRIGGPTKVRGWETLTLTYFERLECCSL